MITLEVDTSELEKAIAEFAAMTKKDLVEITRHQASIMVGHMIEITPPGGKQKLTSNGIPMKAKAAGEGKLAADIARIFPSTTISEPMAKGLIKAGFEWKLSDGSRREVGQTAFSEAELARVHRAARSKKTGRALKGTGGVNMAVTKASVLRAYIAKQIKRVGLLNAGWIAAAAKLKTSAGQVPQWIRRHGAKPGGATQAKTKDAVTVTIFNSQAWFPGDMAPRIKDAIRRRENGLRKAIEAITTRRANAATRRMQ